MNQLISSHIISYITRYQYSSHIYQSETLRDNNSHCTVLHSCILNFHCYEWSVVTLPTWRMFGTRLDIGSLIGVFQLIRESIRQCSNGLLSPSMVGLVGLVRITKVLRRFFGGPRCESEPAVTPSVPILNEIQNCSLQPPSGKCSPEMTHQTRKRIPASHSSAMNRNFKFFQATTAGL